MRETNGTAGLAGHGRPISRQLDLNLLELFECVYRTRNLTAAGAHLGLSQPAMSRALGKLRATYGDPLFVRQQRGVEPTPFADQLLEPVSAALAIVRGTVTPATFAPATDARLFRIAMSDIGERLFLPRLLGYLAVAAPGVGIEVASPSQAELSAELAAGGIDLAVGFLPGLGKAMHEQRLFRERFVYIARTGHPALKHKLTREQLHALPHVVASPPGTQHAAAVEKVLTSRRVRAPIALRVRSFLCVGPVVAKTDLVAAVPSNLAALVAEHMGIQVMDPPMALPGFDVSMLWHHRFHRDPGGQWLRAAFVQLFGPDAESLLV
jgi:DNA-binding transcriptional LysR family regulator